MSLVTFCFVIFASAVYLFFPGGKAAATSISFVGLVSDDWNVPGNWAPAQVPTADDSVTIFNGYFVHVSAGDVAHFSSLTLGGSLTLIGDLGTAGNLTVESTGFLVQQNLNQQILTGTLTVDGTLQHYGPTTTHMASVNMKAQNITVSASGAVSLTGKGFSGGTGANGAGYGPGAGQGSNSGVGAGGGGHAGAGGTGTGASGGAAYCTINAIATMGSGGGASQTDGGDGGGLVILEAVDTLTINGSILAAGGVGEGVFYDAGGAGGGVRLKAATIAGTPTAFSAAGGEGNPAAGGGGSGCVSLTYSVTSSIGLAQIDVSGGTSSHPGEAGSKVSTRLANNAPTSPATSNVATSSVQLSWSAGGGTETYYVLGLSTDGASYAIVATTSLASTNYMFTGLTPGRRYWFEVASGDSAGATSSFAVASPVYTLANPAGTPTASNPTTSTLQLSIDTNGNDATTTYAIYNATAGAYVASDGTATSTSPLYFTSSSWSGTVRGLNVATSYRFSVIARNGDGVNAATSSLSAAVSTFPFSAGTPAVSTPGTSTLAIVLNTGSNPSSTLYALVNVTAGTYIATSGLSNGSVSVFFAASEWNGTAFGLNPNTAYQFSMISEDNVTSSPSTPVYTLALTPGAPTLYDPATSTIALALAAGGNPTNTVFALFNSTTAAYVQSDGTATSSDAAYFTVAGWNGLVQGLMANTAYAFFVLAKNGDGTPTASSSMSNTLYTLAAVPTGLSAVPAGAESITVSWGGNATEYALENTTQSTLSSWFASTSVTVTGLTCNTAYTFRVKGRNGDGVETALSAATGTTTDACAAPPSSGGGGLVLVPAAFVHVTSTPKRSIPALVSPATSTVTSSAEQRPISLPETPAMPAEGQPAERALELDSPIHIVMFPPQSMRRTQPLVYTYEFTNRNRDRQYVRISRWFQNNEGVIIAISGGYRILNPGQPFTYSPRLTLPRWLKPGTYTEQIRAFNRAGELIGQNGFTIEILP